MRIRKESPITSDYVFGGSENDFYRDTPAAVGLAVKDALLLFLGEWFLDTTIGVPFMQGILGKYSQEVADTTLRDQILNVQGVTSIETYSSQIDPVTRRMSVNVTINTLYGVTDVQVANYLIY